MLKNDGLNKTNKLFENLYLVNFLTQCNGFGLLAVSNPRIHAVNQSITLDDGPNFNANFYSLRSYLQETIYFLDTLNNLCIWFRFRTRYIHYSMYLKSQLSLVNRTGGSIFFISKIPSLKSGLWSLMC